MKKTEQSPKWQIYTGEPHAEDSHLRMAELLPEPPSWRSFAQDGGKLVPPASAGNDHLRDYERGASFRPDPAVIEAVNTALFLRRPLLITGTPGTGKSSVINSVARELKLGRVLRWTITSKSELKDGLYLYDAIARLEAKRYNASTRIGDFIELGPLGTALLPGNWPRALLIDEIDKSNLDLPNDLLNIFEEGEFFIPELQRAAYYPENVRMEVREWNSDQRRKIKAGHVRCTHFPFVVMTSNREREFPAAFYRRCVRIAIKDPDEVALGRIVESHFGGKTMENASARELIEKFVSRAQQREMATDQLLNAVYLLVDNQRAFSTTEEREAFIERIYKAISGPEASR